MKNEMFTKSLIWSAIDLLKTIYNFFISYTTVYVTEISKIYEQFKYYVYWKFAINIQYIWMIFTSKKLIKILNIIR